MIFIRRVVGESMLPTLKRGQLIVAVKKPYNLGDVVVAVQKSREVVKRIIRRDDSQVWLEGDNGSASTDSRTLGPVPKTAVKGKVVWPRKLRKD